MKSPIRWLQSDNIKNVFCSKSSLLQTWPCLKLIYNDAVFLETVNAINFNKLIITISPSLLFIFAQLHRCCRWLQEIDLDKPISLLPLNITITSVAPIRSFSRSSIPFFLLSHSTVYFTLQGRVKLCVAEMWVFLPKAVYGQKLSGCSDRPNASGQSRNAGEALSVDPDLTIFSDQCVL